MALGYIADLKSREEGFQPLLLVELRWDASRFGSDQTLYLAASSIDPAETGVVGVNYNGHSYQGRVLNHQLAAWQTLAGNGIGMAPSCALEIADPDLEMWTTYEGVDGPGFRGARVTIRFIFFNPETFEASTDSLVVFRGSVNRPRSSDNILYLDATSMLLMEYMTIPNVRVQKRCGWIHPETAAERAHADDPMSPFQPCGANMLNGDPDDGSVCDHTPAACVRLGRMVRGTVGVGRFGGVRYSQDIPKEYLGKGFDTGNHLTGLNADTTSKYSLYVPIVYGFGWVDCVVTVVYGGANYNRFEAIYCFGYTFDASVPMIGAAADFVDTDRWRTADGWLVTVNGRAVTRGDGRQIAPQLQGVVGLNGWWDWVNKGIRDGTCSRQDGFVADSGNPDYATRTPLGDPYGSMTAFNVGILPQAAASDSLPSIRMLGAGMLIDNAKVDLGSHWENMIIDPADPVNRRMPGVATPWAIWDALQRGGWLLDELDYDRTKIAADKASAWVGYTDAQGVVHDVTSGHPKWKTNLALTKPLALSELVNGLLANCDGILVQGDTLRVQLNETLASQQPNPIPWSNDQTAYASMLVNGDAATGYFAYVFDETNIKQTDRGQSTLTIRELAFEESPNALGFSFADEENQYRNDSLSIVDERDIQRTGRIIPAGDPVLGVPNFDQGYRAAWRRMARASRGNPRYEPTATRPIGTSGTWVASFATTAQAIGLQVGDLIGIRSERYDFGQDTKPQAFRIVEIKVTPDFAEFTITAWWHSDLFNRDDFGQQDEDLYADPGGDGLALAPATWQPYRMQARATDPWFPGEWTFGLRQYYQGRTDGTSDAYLRIQGYLPVNRLADPGTLVPHFTEPPYAISGGTLIPGVTYFVAVTARDAGVAPARETSAQRHLAQVAIPADGTKRTIYIPKITYHGGEGEGVYIGYDPLRLSNQRFSDTLQDTSFTLTFHDANTFGPPDTNAQRLLPVFKRAWHSGVWGQPIDAIPAANQLTVLEAGWTADEWAGRVVSILGRATEVIDGLPLPWWNFLVVSNTADTLVFADVVDFPTIGVQVNDAMVMRTKVTATDGVNVTDAKWVNSLAEPDPIFSKAADPDTGEIVLKLALSNFVEGDHVRVFDAMLLDGVTLDAELNGDWTIHVDGPQLIRLAGSVYSEPGAVNSGFVQILGMRPNEEIGRQFNVIAGPGYSSTSRITGNTSDTVTIDPPIPALSTDSVYTIEEPSWTEAQPTDIFANAVSPGDVVNRADTAIDVPVPNRGGQMMRVGVYVLDATGRRSAAMPSREIWMFGAESASLKQLTEKDRATFGIGIGAVQTIGDDLTNHFMCRLPQGGGTFIEALANCKTPEAAGTLPLKIRIERAPLLLDGTHGPFVTVFPVGVTLDIPPNSVEQVATTVFNPDNPGIDPGDWLRVDLVAGSNEGSQGIEIVLRWGV